MGLCGVARQPICRCHGIHTGKSLHGGLDKTIAQADIGDRLGIVNGRAGIARHPISRKLAERFIAQVGRALLHYPGTRGLGIRGGP